MASIHVVERRPRWPQLPLAQQKPSGEEEGGRKFSPTTYQFVEEEKRKEREREKDKKERKKIAEGGLAVILHCYQRSDNLNSVVRELKLVYATRVMRGYRNHGISPKSKVRDFGKLRKAASRGFTLRDVGVFSYFG